MVPVLLSNILMSVEEESSSWFMLEESRAHLLSIYRLHTGT
jgi:hypothetical protein